MYTKCFKMKHIYIFTIFERFSKCKLKSKKYWNQSQQKFKTTLNFSFKCHVISLFSHAVLNCNKFTLSHCSCYGTQRPDILNQINHLDLSNCFLALICVFFLSFAEPTKEFPNSLWALRTVIWSVSMFNRRRKVTKSH